MGIMDNMMEFMTGRMSKEEKEQMMNKMMEKFFADMTVEDKQKMMNEMMPKMMEGINMAEMMPQMMMRMMSSTDARPPTVSKCEVRMRLSRAHTRYLRVSQIYRTEHPCWAWDKASSCESKIFIVPCVCEKINFCD